MKPKKVLLTGATGMIGKKIYKALLRRGDEITVFTSSMVKGVQKIPGADELIEWNYKEKNQWQKHINGKDAIIHLAGANLFGKRWTKEYKKTIIESRQVGTRNIIDAIAKSEKKPEVFVCASAVGYYGDHGEDEITETAAPGSDFLARVCKIWEDEASKAENYGVRGVSIRTGVVLYKHDGALKQMITPFKFFVGGPLGNGTQWFPWIHINDIVRAYLFAIDNPNLKGAVNAASPQTVRMKDFSKKLGKILSRPSFFRVPSFAIKLAVGEVADTLVNSQRIVPKKLIENNFEFEFESLEESLKNLLKKS